MFDITGKEITYTLYGIVMHSGTLSGGHYTFLRVLGKNRYVKYNDSVVEEINNQNKHCKNHLQNDNIMIAKNQKEYGHRKRIKP
jgi:ubiquitin C-terminal hydrolase